MALPPNAGRFEYRSRLIDHCWVFRQSVLRFSSIRSIQIILRNSELMTHEKMSDSSDTCSIDFLSRPNTDSSASSGIEAEISGQSTASKKSISSVSDHATVTPASQAKRQRKQTKPAKRKNSVLQEIRELQESTDNVIPKQAFQRLAREILTENSADLNRQDYRITGEALLALQESAEMYMTQFFEDCNGAMAHRGAATLNIRDMAIIQMLRRDR